MAFSKLDNLIEAHDRTDSPVECCILKHVVVHRLHSFQLTSARSMSLIGVPGRVAFSKSSIPRNTSSVRRVGMIVSSTCNRSSVVSLENCSADPSWILQAVIFDRSPSNCITKSN